MTVSAGVAAALAMVFAFGGLPPLTDVQQARLDAGAFDDRDHQDEAFVALKENLRGFDGDPGDAPVRVRPDLGALLADPAAFRGDVCRIEGVVQQQTHLPAPHDDALEWFVRCDDGRPIALYIVLPESHRAGRAFHDGQRIGAYARFYKAVQFTDRQGEVRRYPAFVTSHEAIERIGALRGGGGSALTMIVPALAVLLGLFVVLVVWVRRQRATRPQRILARPAADDRVPDDERPLPDDPAAALAALRQRAAEVDQPHRGSRSAERAYAPGRGFWPPHTRSADVHPHDDRG